MRPRSKPAVDIKSCATCERFKREKPSDPDGVCRRFPPTVLQGDEGAVCLWPSVDAAGLCGEYCRITH